MKKNDIEKKFENQCANLQKYIKRMILNISDEKIFEITNRNLDELYKLLNNETTDLISLCDVLSRILIYFENYNASYKLDNNEYDFDNLETNDFSDKYNGAEEEERNGNASFKIKNYKDSKI